MSSCAAGHDRPMLGPASVLYSTEQLIDRPDRGGWDSSYVCQKAAVMKTMSGKTVTVPRVLCSWLMLACWLRAMVATGPHVHEDFDFFLL